MTKAAEFVNNPMVSKNLKNLVSDSMKTQLLEPQRMVIPMAKSDASGNDGVQYGVHIWNSIWGWIRYSYSVNIIIIIWIKLLFCFIIIFNFWIIVYKYPMPKHLLELNVIEAKDLVNADSGPTQGKRDEKHFHWFIHFHSLVLNSCVPYFTRNIGVTFGNFVPYCHISYDLYHESYLAAGVY